MLNVQAANYTTLKHQGPILVNTSSFSSNDFSTYLECSDFIEKVESRKLKRQSSMKARKTREEIFEVSTLDEEEFLKALTNNDANSSMEIQKLDLTKSIENLMKYFDEDVTTDEVEIEKLIKNIDDEQKLKSKNIIQSHQEHDILDEAPIKPKRTRRTSKTSTQSIYEDFKKIAKSNEESANLNTRKNISPKIREMAAMFDQKFSPVKIQKNNNEFIQIEKLKKLKIQKLEMPQINDNEKPVPRVRTVFLNKNQEKCLPKPRPRSKCLEKFEIGSKLSIFNGLNPPKNADIKKPNVDKILKDKTLIKKSEIPNKIEPEYHLEIPEKLQSLKSNSNISQKSNNLNDITSVCEQKSFEKYLAQPKNIEEPNNKSSDTPKYFGWNIKTNNSKIEETTKNSKIPEQQPKQKMDTTGCLIHDETFSKLSVKNKIMLFNKFVEEVNQSAKSKSPNNNIKKQTKSPAEILNSLQFENNKTPSPNESRSGPTKKEVIENIQKVIADLKLKLNNSKEHDTTSPSNNIKKLAIPKESDLHVSSIIVHLQQSPPIKRLRNSESDSSIKNSSEKFFRADEIANKNYVLDDTVTEPLSDSNFETPCKDLASADTVIEPFGESTLASLNKLTFTPSTPNNDENISPKRGNESLCSCIPLFDIYGPPKKIRRTKLERSKIFANRYLESMFYQWLALGCPKDDETLKRLENNEAIQLNDKSNENKQDNDKEGAEAHVEVENIKKTFQPENVSPLDTSNSPRRKSLRRGLRWKSDDSIIEKCTPPQSPKVPEITSLLQQKPSQIQQPQQQHKQNQHQLQQKQQNPQPEQIHNSEEDSNSCTSSMSIWTKNSLYDTDEKNDYNQKNRNFIIGASSQNSKTHQKLNQNEPVNSFIEVDSKLIRTCQSPARVKRAYTLTVLSSPSPSLVYETENWNVESIRYNPLHDISTFSRSWSHLPSIDSGVVKENESTVQSSYYTASNQSSKHTPNKSQKSLSCQNLIENYSSDDHDDQNDTLQATYNTDNNDKDVTIDEIIIDIEYYGCNDSDDKKEVHFRDDTNDQPAKINIKSYRKTPRKPSSKNSEKPPVVMNDTNQDNFQIKSSWSHFSPIKNRNKNLKNQYEIEDKRSIWTRLEDLCISNDKNNDESELNNQNHDNIESNKNIENENIGTVPTAIGSHLSQKSNESNINQFSKFWISSDHCRITFKIYRVDSEKLHKIENDFNQNSNKKLNFGIDDVHYFPKKNIKLEFERSKTTSTYWFTYDDHMISFAGKYIPKNQINQIFQVLKGSDLNFGIDDIKLSTNSLNKNVRKMLLKPDGSLARNSTYSKTSDLGPSELFDSDSDHQPELNSIFNNNSNNNNNQQTNQDNQKVYRTSAVSSSIEDHPPSSVAVTPDSGEALSSEAEVEIDPMDSLFNWVKESTEKTQQNISRPLKTTSQTTTEIKEEQPEKKKNVKDEFNLFSVHGGAIEKLIKQREELQKIEERVRPFTWRSSNSTDLGFAGNGSPDHLRRLGNMVTAIQLIAKDEYNGCTREQLESFIYTLCKHGDLCLMNCISQINGILDVLIVLDEKQYAKNM